MCKRVRAREGEKQRENAKQGERQHECAHVRANTWAREGGGDKKKERERVQGGEDSKDPLSCRSFSTKEPLNIGHFCGK